MKHANLTYNGILRLGSPIGMKINQLTDADRKGTGNSRWRPLPAAVSRFAPALAGLLLLSGCTNIPDWSPDLMPDWLPDLTGSEGKVAQRVPSSIIDAPPEEPGQIAAPTPVPQGPSRDEVRAIQADLAELGYDPGQFDGIAGQRTREAIKAYQNDAGLAVDDSITQELADSLATAPRPENPPAPGTPPNIDPELAPGSEPETELAGKPEVELAIKPEIEPKIEPPVEVVRVENAAIPPLYDPGDAYIWSNGRVETVVRIAVDKLFWRVDNGVRFTADRNFLIPPASWTGPSGKGESDSRLNTRASWPLAAESLLAFDVANNSAVEGWQCKIDGTERVRVPAGQFDVVALACDRDSAPLGEWVRRIWHYAPAVRHYVARIDIMPDGSRTSKELVGVRPGAEDWPPAVRAGLDRAIQDALAGPSDGERSLWSSTMVKEEFTILPGATRDDGDGRRCRTFELTAHSAGVSRIYPALACMSGEGQKWRILDNHDGRPDDNSFLTNAS
jgi:peptidoglycan hydrolase-like protein with peptidoglycan-binding domain